MLSGEGSIPSFPEVLIQVVKTAFVGVHVALIQDLGQGDFDPDSLKDLE